MGGFSFRPFPLRVADVLRLWNWSFHHPVPPYFALSPPTPAPYHFAFLAPASSVLPHPRQKHVAHIKDLQLKQTNKKKLSTLLLKSQSRSAYGGEQNSTKVEHQMGGGSGFPPEARDMLSNGCSFRLLNIETTLKNGSDRD